MYGLSAKGLLSDFFCSFTTNLVIFITFSFFIDTTIQVIQVSSVLIFFCPLSILIT